MRTNTAILWNYLCLKLPCGIFRTCLPKQCVHLLIECLKWCGLNIFIKLPKKTLTSGYNGSTSGIKVLANLAYEVDQERLDNLLQFSTDFWIGKRPPLGVESDEIGVKCGNCVWARVCDWRNKMESA